MLDCSVTLAWLFEDESTPATDALAVRVAVQGAVVPGLWRAEVANGLQMAVRRKRIDVSYRNSALLRLGTLDIRVDPETDANVWSAVIELADHGGLTVYDACYLELAQRRGLPLATIDKALSRAARQVAVTVVP